MNYCSNCGHLVSHEIPAGDSRMRHVCHGCGRIHYENPRVVVGCVAEHQGSILLCRRAIEPRRGFWTVPAGFMENGETIAEAAMRETLEEAMAHVTLGTMFAVVDVVHAHQVHVFFSGRLVAAEFGVGEETLETRLFPPGALPWQDIAFPSVTIALERYLAGAAQGTGPVHLAVAARHSPA